MNDDERRTAPPRASTREGHVPTSADQPTVVLPTQPDTPHEPAPRDRASSERTSRESAPRDPAPHESAPGDPRQHEGTPQESREGVVRRSGAQPEGTPPDRSTEGGRGERIQRLAVPVAAWGSEGSDGDGDGAEALGRKLSSDQTTIIIPAQHAAKRVGGGGSGSWPPGEVRLGSSVIWPMPKPLAKRVALGAAVLVVAVAAFAGLRQLADAPAAPVGSHSTVPGHTSATPDEAAAGVQRATDGGAVLRKMVEAVRTQDRSAFLDTIDPQAKDFDDQARMIYTNLDKLPLATFQLRYVSDDPGALEPDRQRTLGGEKSWLAQIEVSWQLSGYDAKPARETLPVTFVQRGGTTYAASFSERFVAGQRRPIWALGAIDVAKSDHALVISLNSQANADDYATVTDRAVDAVSDVWGDNWRKKAVVYLPAKQSQMEYVLGAPQGTYSQIAAVTMAELDTPAAGAPVRIVANPKLFEELGKQGRRIVLTHETTHVASTATASPVPLWLAEGFADYVAFTAVSVQDESAAKELFKAVRAGKVPKTLPPPEAFAATSSELPQAYESGWLACRLIAEREGQSKLVKFYRTVHASKSPTGLADAFRTVLGTTEQQFVADWQKYIQRLAGV
ncbi:DUF4412 domain-containing protein [Kribbella amoyensis]|uniref:DUF4412 domain-containing protein n=1 Tax=Kribbella amoyensis TaxID=996641 RepID=UPI001EE25DE1|nr:DUF4412 domain-containing protein [Kribbella amoyensis]